jgi:hypothetical protein
MIEAKGPTGVFHLRVLVLTGSLVALCISEGVGLQLLPLPSVREKTPDSRRVCHLADPLPDPSQDQSPCRIEIVEPKLRKVYVALSLLNVLAEPPVDSGETPAGGGLHQRSPTSISGYLLDFCYRPTGRAPPDSV